MIGQQADQLIPPPPAWSHEGGFFMGAIYPSIEVTLPDVHLFQQLRILFHLLIIFKGKTKRPMQSRIRWI
jgi:hypothetical protein